MKTTVEWLEKELMRTNRLYTIKDIFNQAKEMEKQLIIDAWNNGLSNWDNTDNLSAEQYYNETFYK
jgi:hypothetical protein